MKKVLILGTITFNHFSDEFADRFSDKKAKTNALIHDVNGFIVHDNELYLEDIGEDSGQDYVIVNLFDGEIAFLEPEFENLVKRVISTIE